MKYLLTILFYLGFLLGQEDVSPNLIQDETKFFGDYTIESGVINHDNIRVVGGNVFIYGTVDGKITVVGGDVILGSTAVVNGTIIAIGGIVQKDEKAAIHGKIIETHLKEGLVYREMESADDINGEPHFKIREKSMRSSESWIHPHIDWFIYNRNEGLVFTPLNSQWDGNGLSSFRLSFSIGYRFGTDEPAGRLTFEKSFFPNNNLVFFGSVFKESRTDDYYRLSEDENSWSGLLGRQDFYDRWDEEGWSAGMGLDFYRIKIKILAASVKQDTIAVDPQLWSLFEKERHLRPNPYLDPHEFVHYLQATLAFRTKYYSPVATGMALFIQGESYHNGISASEIYSLNSEDIISRIFGFIKLNWEMSYGLVLRSQFMAGTSNSQLDLFRKFGVGGLGSVSAFPFKYQRGSQMIQTNGEIVFTDEFTGEWFFIKLFFDGGYAWDGDSFILNQQKVLDNGISSVGLGVGNGDDEDLNWSLNIAKPLDGRDFIETTVRLNYNF